MFFFLLQTEQGDIFKVTLETEDDVVSGLFECMVSFTLENLLHVGD